MEITETATVKKNYFKEDRKLVSEAFTFVKKKKIKKKLTLRRNEKCHHVLCSGSRVICYSKLQIDFDCFQSSSSSWLVQP